DHVLQRVSESAGLVRRELDDESAAAFEGHPHHDATPLLDHFERAVARPRLHRRHARSPSSSGGPPPGWAGRALYIRTGPAGAGGALGGGRGTAALSDAPLRTRPGAGHADTLTEAHYPARHRPWEITT